MHIIYNFFTTLSAIFVYFDLFGTGSLLSSGQDRLVVERFLLLGLLQYHRNNYVTMRVLRYNNYYYVE